MLYGAVERRVLGRMTMEGCAVLRGVVETCVSSDEVMDGGRG